MQKKYGNGHYDNNPSDNPKVLADAEEDPNAVYGYKPKKDGSLKNFANVDWSDPEFVESARQKRIQYIEDDRSICDLVSDMKNYNVPLVKTQMKKIIVTAKTLYSHPKNVSKIYAALHTDLAW